MHTGPVSSGSIKLLVQRRNTLGGANGRWRGGGGKRIIGLAGRGTGLSGQRCGVARRRSHGSGWGRLLELLLRLEHVVPADGQRLILGVVDGFEQRCDFVGAEHLVALATNGQRLVLRVVDRFEQRFVLVGAEHLVVFATDGQRLVLRDRRRA